MSDAEKFAIARQLFSKLDSDIQHEKSYHSGNEGAQEALKRIANQVNATITRLNHLE